MANHVDKKISAVVISVFKESVTVMEKIIHAQKVHLSVAAINVNRENATVVCRTLGATQTATVVATIVSMAGANVLIRTRHAKKTVPVAAAFVVQDDVPVAHMSVDARKTVTVAATVVSRESATAVRKVLRAKKTMSAAATSVNKESAAVVGSILNVQKKLIVVPGFVIIKEHATVYLVIKNAQQTPTVVPEFVRQPTGNANVLESVGNAQTNPTVAAPLFVLRRDAVYPLPSRLARKDMKNALIPIKQNTVAPPTYVVVDIVVSALDPPRR